MDVYLQPDAPDPVLDAALVRELAAEHAEHAGAVVEVDESGGEARAYLLEGDVVVKTQRPHRLRPRTSLAKEAALLARVAGSLGSKVPRLYGHGRRDTPAGVVEYLVMSRMPGRATRHVPLDAGQRQRLARETGRLIARLHAAPTGELLERDGLVPLDADGQALRARLEFGFADLADLSAEHPERWTAVVSPDEAAKRALAVVPERFTPVVLHSNPGPTHVFCDEDGNLTGVIDFGDAYASHPAMDLRAWPDPADRLAVREGYLDGAAPSAEFEAGWTAAMIYSDAAVVLTRPELAEAAARDLMERLKAC
jgi:aminoglycoside phosphotransferase (APT) family kinase protein